MLLTDARRAARSRPDGAVVPLEEQDRGLWDREAVADGVAIVTDALARARIGPYQGPGRDRRHPRRGAEHRGDRLAAGPRALPAAGPPGAEPDGHPQRGRGPGHGRGPARRARLLATLEADGRIRDHHRLDAVRGHLLERLGDRDAARAAYQRAARRTTSLPERRYLESRAARLRPSGR